MKLKELKEILNERLKSLSGVKVKSAQEFHDLKKNILIEETQKYGFRIQYFSLELELGNDIVYRTENIFKIILDFKQDRRYNHYVLVGTIQSVCVELSDEMKRYEDIDLEYLNDFYVRDTIKNIIVNKQEKIKKKMYEIELEKEAIEKYQYEYEKANKKLKSLNLE